MFPLILRVLNRDYTRGYSNPDSGLLVQGGISEYPKANGSNWIRVD